MDQDASEKRTGAEPESDPEATAAEQPGEEPGEPPKEYQVEVFPDWCKACGICAAFCPKECIEQDAEGRPVIAAAWKCTGCRWCELHCPDFAICVKELLAGEKKAEAD